MGKMVKELCKEITDRVRRGELTAQQGRTLVGQAKRGDAEGALRGMERMRRG